MKIEPLGSGCFQIWLNKQDMHRFGLQFETLSADNGPTRAAVTRLLAVARSRALFTEEALTVEALSVGDGCLLVCTARHGLPPPRMPLPRVYQVESADDLLSLGDRLSRVGELPAASLFGWGDAYRLIVYSGIVTPHGVRRRLGEYASLVGEGAAAAAFTEEHGAPISVGNALHLITRESR